MNEHGQCFELIEQTRQVVRRIEAAAGDGTLPPCVAFTLSKELLVALLATLPSTGSEIGRLYAALSREQKS